MCCIKFQPATKSIVKRNLFNTALPPLNTNKDTKNLSLFLFQKCLRVKETVKDTTQPSKQGNEHNGKRKNKQTHAAPIQGEAVNMSSSEDKAKVKLLVVKIVLFSLFHTLK